jgi:hypothetical protein
MACLPFWLARLTARAVEVNVMTAHSAQRTYEPQMPGFWVFSSVYTAIFALAAVGLVYLAAACWTAL